MLIVYGTRTFRKNLGVSKSLVKCEFCGREAKWQYNRFRKWGTLYWIPLFPMKTHYLFHCPECEHGIEIPENNFYRISSQVILNKPGKFS